MDVSALSNQELREKLLDLGENPGPITCGTTRTVYERKLLRLLGQESEEQQDQRYPKTHDTDDSDPEEEESAVPWHRQEPLRSRARPQSAVQRRAAPAHAMEEGGRGGGAVLSCLAVILALVLVTGVVVLALMFLGGEEVEPHLLEADGAHGEAV
ncbi:lamina-associated polypeptide 2, isoforms beta/gamma-like [Petromyzon marinus]|uniref:Lamina-associated polypeptide 2-like n=1 Tax=Petromyzon marinus TaxID=7757 RepID=A0AAJ7XBX3_PETMA|nr:lamina-associated polypeptide 2-like [Petromyzon marinus]XP_032827575.1 lamina-associated polypeptide 2-like [Petromyzon marinus]XP_032827576.1 lamina-associated polypeptide 2-like [Petromyzon marinus]XP_032827577.1 lamina-associated polypeptide 2-like [Petromyzon marinus]XP_032827578.1 lamina-associated polypeptide 2-like [Petromyzon marinus]XP_032827579.1 lamina-associated polypeptide 2-like [Petromyzon marinus]XP_032827580.1 lamina-associated polypeptide 2-like [Petromyzon marinus]XP_0